MEARELRIDNLVEYNGMFCRVSDITAPSPMKDERFSDKWCIGLLCGGFIDTTIEFISPIPLTEEWLSRFGAELIEDGFDSDEGGRVCIIDFDVFRTEWSAKDNYWKVYRRMTKEWQSLDDLYISNVKFVHEWQNLIFALTGEELQTSTT